MYKHVFRVTVRVGFHEFHAEFDHEKAALECFNSIAVPSEDVEIEGDSISLNSEAEVADVTIRRFTVPIKVGEPSRQ